MEDFQDRTLASTLSCGMQVQPVITQWTTLVLGLLSTDTSLVKSFFLFLMQDHQLKSLPAVCLVATMKLAIPMCRSRSNIVASKTIAVRAIWLP